MRRLILVSLLAHLAAGGLLAAALRWSPAPPPADPARIEVLFGHGGGAARPAPPPSPAEPARAVAPPMPADGEATPAPAQAGAAVESAPRPPAAPAAPRGADDTPGVRIERPDEQTIAAQDDTGNHQPDYPEAAAEAGQHGRVLVRLHIDSTGAVAGIDLLESSGFALLDEAALSTLRAWKFLPARRNGAPIPWDRDQPVDFVLAPRFGLAR